MSVKELDEVSFSPASLQFSVGDNERLLILQDERLAFDGYHTWLAPAKSQQLYFAGTRDQLRCGKEPAFPSEPFKVGRLRNVVHNGRSSTNLSTKVKLLLLPSHVRL